MRYNYPELLKLNPKAAQLAAQVGKFSRNKMVVEVPNETKFEGEMPPTISKGLGDDMAKIAQPIARIIDALTGTNLSNCKNCGGRKNKLNAVFPKLLN